MFALLGLIGLALAGTAFVGVMTPADDDGDSSDGIDLTPQDGTATEDQPDLLQSLDWDEPDNIVAIGSDAEDVLTGDGGNDYLEGGSADDVMNGGAGGDQLHGGAGDDSVAGDSGDDLVYGYIGDDELSGGAGDDDLHAGDGDDFVSGGAGNDLISGGYGDDTLIGGEGRDNIQGSEGDDVIDGVTGETIAEQDYLNGSEGNDILIGNNSDVMSGGDGADRFEIINGTVSIMDYTEDDLLVLSYEGEIPVLTTEDSENGLTLLADGMPVASLFGLTSFDVSTVQLVAA